MRFELEDVTIASSFEPYLSVKQGKTLSERLRNVETLARLHVTRVDDVNSGEDGHIGFEMPQEIDIIIHPRFDFRITTDTIPSDRFTVMEGYAIALARYVAQTRRTTTIRTKLTAYWSPSKTGSKRISELYPMLGIEKQVRADARISSVLVSTSHNTGISLGSAKRVGFVSVRIMPVTEVSKGFLAKGVRGVLSFISSVV
ncbi:MAG TPA: hypothetical protein VJZ03_04250 [Candidatus Bathyarchaeia archaeon]|nr:hypothetical protein [Candidatus Bathyarchaeia archaeon]